MENFSFLTAENILDAAKAEAIGSTSSSVSALQETQMIERIEQLNAEFVYSAHTKHPKGGWSWMQSVYNFNTKNNTSLNGAIAAGAATLVLTDASDFDSSGRIVIETSKNALDFIDYSSKATHTLTVSTTTGDQTVGLAHSDGAWVEKLYPLPSNYGKTRELNVNSVLYFYEKLQGFPRIGYFSTFGNYFLMPKSIGEQDVTLFYEKKPSTITALTSSTDIPVQFQRWAIEKLKAHIYMIRRQRSDIGTSLQLAEVELAQALDYDTSELSSASLNILPLPY